MRPALLLLLAGCSAPARGVPVNLLVMNATARPEKVSTSIHDARTGEELFRRTSYLLPEGGEELRPAVSVEAFSRLKVCAVVPAYPGASMCVTHQTGAASVECYASAFPQKGSPPYASVTCHNGE